MFMCMFASMRENLTMESVFDCQNSFWNHCSSFFLIQSMEDLHTFIWDLCVVKNGLPGILPESWTCELQSRIYLWCSWVISFLGPEYNPWISGAPGSSRNSGQNLPITQPLSGWDLQPLWKGVLQQCSETCANQHFSLAKRPVSVTWQRSFGNTAGFGWTRPLSRLCCAYTLL